MPRLYNLEPYPVVPNMHALAVLPGESYDFTDEQVTAGITGQWSENDPRGPAPQVKVETTAPATPTAPGPTIEPAPPEKE